MVLALWCCAALRAQELEPRAYSISPVGTNFAVLAFARSWGDVNFDPSLPVENGSSVLHGVFFGYGRALNFFGRSANVAATLPYAWGDLSGDVYGVPQQVRRSGLGDMGVRFAVNLYGAPAMNLEKFSRYRQKTNVGASVAVVVPSGQYDPARFVNIGSNRWAVKPEIGLSERYRRWYFDLYIGAWIYSANSDFRGTTRRQDVLGTSQIHVSYNLATRCWVAFDANFYTGGRTIVDDVRKADFQRNSRVGGTIAIPLSRRQSVKISAAGGAVTNIGADFTSIAVSYQYLWGAGL